MGKLCLYCKHFYLTTGEPGYSEMTPGSDFDMSCDRRHWEFAPHDQSQEEFKRTLETGLTCKDFTKAKP